MKDKILAFLKTKIEGGQEAFLQGVAKDLSETITDEAQIETAINDGVIRAIKSSQKFFQSDSDRRVTDGIKTYETKHGLKDGKPVVIPTPPAEGKPTDEIPAWAKKLLDSNEQLVGKVTAFETEKTKANLHDKLKQRLVKDLKIDEKDLKDFNLLTGVEIVAESDIESIANGIKERHDATLQSLKDRGVQIAVPKEGNAGGGLLKDIKEWNKDKKVDK